MNWLAVYLNGRYVFIHSIKWKFQMLRDKLCVLSFVINFVNQASPPP